MSAVLRLAYFRGRFQQVDVGAHGVITFASTDGAMLVRQPSLTAAGDIGLRLTNVPNFWRMVTEKTGVFTYSVDSVKQMRAYRHRWPAAHHYCRPRARRHLRGMVAARRLVDRGHQRGLLEILMLAWDSGASCAGANWRSRILRNSPRRSAAWRLPIR